MTEQQKHLIEGGATVTLLLLLLFWLFHSATSQANAATIPDDTAGQSAQPNDGLSLPAVVFHPLEVVSPSENFPLILNIPLVTYRLYVPNATDNLPCECRDCPVSPYTIGTINQMQALGVAYANAMIEASNNTEQAVIQSFANAGENVYYVENGIGN